MPWHLGTLHPTRTPSGKSLFDGDRTQGLGLLYNLVIKYEYLHQYGRDVRDLLHCVQDHCEPYPHRGRPDGGAPDNFTSDMQDGMALACVLHAHFADLIDLAMVSGIENALDNNLLALAGTQASRPSRHGKPVPDRCSVCFVVAALERIGEGAAARRQRQAGGRDRAGIGSGENSC
jgi:hypothetical protein